MSWRTGASGLAAAVLLLGLAGCERGADSGATANPVAPGQPGTGNPVEQVAPRADSPNESPQIGGAREQVPAGITGSGGTTDVPGELQGRSQLGGPGTGLQGGLGGGGADPSTASTATSTTQPGAATSGSSNAVPGN
jgi:hypothetical protein